MVNCWAHFTKTKQKEMDLGGTVQGFILSILRNFRILNIVDLWSDFLEEVDFFLRSVQK